MIKDEIVEFINNELGDELKILDIKNNYVKLLWPLEPYIESEEIEVIMYYALDDIEIIYNYNETGDY